MALQTYYNAFVAAMSDGGFCQHFYGTWTDSRDCMKAFGKLEESSSKVKYAVKGGGGLHVLPSYVQSGDCMIQIEVAGPRTPQSVELIPNQIRDMAERVLETCTQGTDLYGGFVTSDMTAMKDWITSAETDLDGYYPPETSYITVAISNVVSDWLSPGNYDPVIPQILASTEFAAISKVPGGSPLRNNLRKRADRFLRQQMKMEPRGQRIAWWDNPGSGNLQESYRNASIIRLSESNRTVTRQLKRN